MSILAMALIGLNLPVIARPQPGPPAPMVYDSWLGWIPKPGWCGIYSDFRGEYEGARTTVDGEGLRWSGRRFPGRPIVVAGDSFAFGAEVADAETWPALLSARLRRTVYNGGVVGYGLDQAVLRLRALADEHQPEIAVLAVFADDVPRCGYRQRVRSKPWFVPTSSGLLLHDVPVPLEPPGAMTRAQTDGWEVSYRLVRSLQGLAPRVLVVLLADQRRGDERLLEPVREGAHVAGLEVLDLSRETPPSMFRVVHFNPAGNLFVASRIAKALR